MQMDRLQEVPVEGDDDEDAGEGRRGPPRLRVRRRGPVQGRLANVRCEGLGHAFGVSGLK